MFLSGWGQGESTPWDHPKGASALVSALTEPVQLNLRATLMDDDGK